MYEVQPFLISVTQLLLDKWFCLPVDHWMSSPLQCCSDLCKFCFLLLCVCKFYFISQHQSLGLFLNQRSEFLSQSISSICSEAGKSRLGSMHTPYSKQIHLRGLGKNITFKDEVSEPQDVMVEWVVMGVRQLECLFLLYDILVGKKSIEGTFAWEDADIMSILCKAFVPLPRQMIN